MNSDVLESVVAKLRIAAAGVEETDQSPRIGWAWMMPDYRASRSRAFHGHRSALTIVDGGLEPLVAAVETIHCDATARPLWRLEDLWSVTLQLLAASYESPGLQLDAAVRKIADPEPAREIAALANVSWSAPPTHIGPVTIASVEHTKDSKLLARKIGLNSNGARALDEHVTRMLRESGPFVLATSTSRRQQHLAHEDFTRDVEDLFGLTLMLSERLNDPGFLPRRGPTNRPGIRGLTLDREALGQLLASHGSSELGAAILSVTGWGAGTSLHWYSAEPLPLDTLLDQALLPVVGDVMSSRDAIAQRLKVAARWYARGHWSEADDDAALAVSVALDSLLTGKEAVPGAVSKGRFALLERQPARRHERFKRYAELYAVRSAIAHGGSADEGLTRIGGVASMLRDTHWVATQMLLLRELVHPESDNDMRDMWNGIQWGTIPWAHRLGQ